MLNCYPSWNYHFAPEKKWGWKTQFILGSSYFQGRDVSLRGKCNLLLILEKLVTDPLTKGVITSTSLPPFTNGPQQCTSTGTLSWLPPDPKGHENVAGWCWQVPIKKELLHFILKSLKRHLLLHERKLSKKMWPSFPWFDKVLWCPNGWFETMRGWWISTCPSPVSQILA